MSHSERQDAIWTSARGAVPRTHAFGIMGIVNLTTDSFHAASRSPDLEAALARCRALRAGGADVLDLGAESSRPGAAPVRADDEIARLVPLIDELKACMPDVCLSVDTYHAATAAQVLEHGADIINDISACSFDPGMADVLVQYRPGYVLMHCQGTPKTMQDNPVYDDVCAEVAAFFEKKLNMLVAAGLPEERILLDPGIGFGKTMGHNLALMRSTAPWAHLGRPSLMACSMKSVFGNLLGLPVAERGTATCVATALTWKSGYTWHRVHDVAAALQSLQLAAALSCEACND